MTIGHNSADINGVEGSPNERLRHYVERIGRVEDERDVAVGEFREMLKEVRAEAKAAGYDMKALAEMVRLYRMEPADRDEREALRDFYRDVVFRKIGDVPESEEGSSSNGSKEAPPHNPETGEIIEQNAQRPSNRDVSAGDEPSPEAGPQAEASLAGTGAGTPAGHEGHTAERGGQAVEAVAEDGQPDPDTEPDYFEIPENLRRTVV